MKLFQVNEMWLGISGEKPTAKGHDEKSEIIESSFHKAIEII